MKKASTPRRWLALLLALALAFSLSPLSLAADGDESETPPTGGETTNPPEGSEDDSNTPGTPETPAGGTIVITSADSGYSLGNPINPGDTVNLRAVINGSPNAVFAWSSDSSVVTVTYPTGGQTAQIRGVSPGTAVITITANGVSTSIEMTVSGIAIPEGMNNISILQNQSKTLVENTDFVRYGTAAGEGTIIATITSDKSNVARVSGGDTTSWSGLAITGITEGNARVTLTATANGKPLGGPAEYSITVESNQAPPIPGRASNSNPLRFSTILSQIAAQCSSMISGTTLVSVTGLSVSTDQGTLYLNYKSADDTGSGVGSALTYYASGDVGPFLKDVVFVPNPSYTGDKVMITFTGNADNGRTFKGRIEVTIDPATTNITLSASPESPAQFTGSAFGEVCRQETGAPLSYVIFTLPPANQGILYEGYVSDTDYAARVTATNQYNQTTLNNLTFVPTPGYVGLVSISYAGYSATGVRYNGEVHINVTQSLDQCITYNDEGSGVVYFSEADFSAYCLNVTGDRLNYVSFTPPASSQGTLYRSWTNNRGSVVTAENVFYAGQRASAIDAITFVAVDGFSGTVRIPFSGEDRSGVPFTGTVEINVQTSNAGNITYSCTPGGSVKLTASDFNDMCLRLTGQRLHYITFQSLPDYTNGAFYHNRTSAGGMGDSVSREARYYNSSAPYIMNLSFWASDSFRGSIEVPFTGCAVSGETFSSVLVITSSTSVGGSNTVSYATDGRTPITFAAADFDAVSRSATNSALNYLRFTLPSSGEGILYFDYNPTVAPVAISSTDSLYQSGDATVSKVTFLPAYGYSGTVYIPFSGWAISGAQFQGTVVITVRGSATDTAVRYSTRGEPVALSGYAFQGTGGRQLVSIRLDALPEASEGRLYYQYTCPGKFSWMAAVGTDYYLTGDPLISSLTFVPRAGYSGQVAIPYTAVNADGTTFQGQISITVEPVTASAYFNDLPYANAETVAAVDYLYCCGVVGGVSVGKFAPDQTIRRGDFCLMLYRAFQFTANGTATHFIDVPSDAYYAQAIQVLRTLEIVNGTGGNRFEPTADISRQDAALIIQRALRVAGMTIPDGAAALLGYFPDGAATSDYAQGAVASLIQLDLLPTSWTRLSSRSALTRADMAVMLHRAMTR